jgi:hypothetical protein
MMKNAASPKPDGATKTIQSTQVAKISIAQNSCQSALAISIFSDAAVALAA